MPSVLIVDDEPDMRYLLRCLVEEDHWVVVAEAANGADALEVWREVEVDVVLLDQRMPGLSGLGAAEIILGEDDAQAIVLFSMMMEDEVVRAAAELGVRACVPKTDLAGLLAVMNAQISDRGTARAGREAR